MIVSQRKGIGPSYILNFLAKDPIYSHPNYYDLWFKVRGPVNDAKDPLGDY